MSFENINAPRRTDEMFRQREQREHHKANSVIEELKIDMIASFSVADSLHLLELGTDEKINSSVYTLAIFLHHIWL